MISAWVWAVLGALLCVVVAETSIIAELVRQTDRILRTIFPSYRADAEGGGGKSGHYSMYQHRREDKG